MVRTLQSMSERPGIHDVLGAVRIDASVFERYELGAPWSVRIPPTPGRLVFYAPGSGGAPLEEVGPGASRRTAGGRPT
jgi:hypothetical protein